MVCNASNLLSTNTREWTATIQLKTYLCWNEVEQFLWDTQFWSNLQREGTLNRFQKQTIFNTVFTVTNVSHMVAWTHIKFCHLLYKCTTTAIKYGCWLLSLFHSSLLQIKWRQRNHFNTKYELVSQLGQKKMKTTLIRVLHVHFMHARPFWMVT